LKSVEILSPEANLISSHRTKTTSFRRYGIAEADTARDFLLKTGLKSEFGSVDPDLSVTKSNRAYAVSSDTPPEAYIFLGGAGAEIRRSRLWSLKSVLDVLRVLRVPAARPGTRHFRAEHVAGKARSGGPPARRPGPEGPSTFKALQARPPGF
jgi:hypothetical protein